MSIKTEEAKIVEAAMKRFENESLQFPHEFVKTVLTQALATYKASILSECEKCVPEEVPKFAVNDDDEAKTIQADFAEGFRRCRTQTLQAINSLK